MSRYYKPRKDYPDLRKPRHRPWLRRPKDPLVTFANELLRFCLTCLVVVVAFALAVVASR
jgi:hypothetical protein